MEERDRGERLVVVWRLKRDQFAVHGAGSKMISRRE